MSYFRGGGSLVDQMMKMMEDVRFVSFEKFDVRKDRDGKWRFLE